jgi:hypothetical protein
VLIGNFITAKHQVKILKIEKYKYLIHQANKKDHNICTLVILNEEIQFIKKIFSKGMTKYFHNDFIPSSESTCHNNNNSTHIVTSVDDNIDSFLVILNFLLVCLMIFHFLNKVELEECNYRVKSRPFIVCLNHLFK